MTLVDGSALALNGFKLMSVVAAGWGLIDGLGPDESEAVVRRETAISKIEFALRTPAVRPPIGFETERPIP